MDVRQSYQGVLPRLDVTGGFGRLFVGETEEVTVVFNPTPPPDFVRSAASVPASDFGDYRYNLALSWTLFDGLASWNLISASRTRSTASERQLDESTLRVAFEVTRRFYELVNSNARSRCGARRRRSPRSSSSAPTPSSRRAVARRPTPTPRGSISATTGSRCATRPRSWRAPAPTWPSSSGSPRPPGWRSFHPAPSPDRSFRRRSPLRFRSCWRRLGSGDPSSRRGSCRARRATRRSARARRLLAGARCPGVLREDVRRGGRAIGALRRSVGPVRRLGAVHRGVEPVRGRRDAGERAARRGRVAPCVDPPRARRADGLRRGDRRPRAVGGADRHRARRSRRTSPPPKQAFASRRSGSRQESRASSRCETPRSSSRRRGSSGSARSWTSSWLVPT